jgi:P-type conjugative transfer protein TrbG
MKTALIVIAGVVSPALAYAADRLPAGAPLPPEPASAPASPALGAATPPAELQAAKPSVAARPWRPKPLPPAARRVAQANAGARVAPAVGGSLQALQVYPFSEGALFEVYAAPDRVTDIVLQPGETLAGTGPVAAGDTVRWIIGDTKSGVGAGRRVHILVKPTRGDLETNLVINTDRRTYHLELHATATVAMAEVSWRYPDESLVAIRGVPTPSAATAADAPRATAPVLDIDRLEFGYRLEGDKPAWRPLRVFDDGRQVIIDFPADLAAVDLPPLFIVQGKTAELVNYRVLGRRMVVDRLFQTAELRLGGPRGRQQVVRIVRQGAER